MAGSPFKVAVFLGVFILSGAAFADTVPMTLTGVYNTGATMGGVYSSPYWVTIDGVTTLAICDDFLTDISINHSWDAIQYALSDVSTGGPQKFRTAVWGVDNTALTIEQEYTAAALLAEDLLLSANLSNPILAGEYSYAIWTIFDPLAINGYMGQLTDLTYKKAIDDLRTAAFEEALNGAAPSATISIYTPDPLTASQEFLVVRTPEASASAILVVNLLALFGGVFLCRRRLTRSLSN